MTERSAVLRAADRGSWPANEDDASWDELRAWAFQWACLLADIDEAKAWVDAMARLAASQFPHEEYNVYRLEMLSDRIRRRKLAQSALRWKFGYKTGRREALIRSDIREFHRTNRAAVPSGADHG